MTNNVERSRLAPDERRQQIVDVARAHFQRHGVAGASMSAIAREADVTRALIYHYFAGKEALVAAVLRDEADRLLEATAVDATMAPRENLRRALSAYFDHFDASSGVIRDLYAPGQASADMTSPIVAANHDVQVERIIAATGCSESPTTRVIVGAWLAFVEHLARHGVADEARIDRCIRALESALDITLPPTTNGRS